jgi:hypothetical protein
MQAAFSEGHGRHFDVGLDLAGAKGNQTGERDQERVIHTDHVQQPIAALIVDTGGAGVENELFSMSESIPVR